MVEVIGFHKRSKGAKGQSIGEGNCSISYQTGADPVLKGKHPTNDMRNRGNEAESLSMHTSYENMRICLTPNSWICYSCHRDYTRNKGNENYI